MKLLPALAASAWLTTAQAQSVPPSTSTLPPPPASTPGQASSTAAQPPQRGNIAPILDIRIQDEGIRLPKSRDDAPPPEKPPAK